LIASIVAMNAASIAILRVNMPAPDGLPDAIRTTAGNLGIDPVDLATAISYETGGRLDPGLYGGAGGKYLGLIQFGPAEQKQYGVHAGQSAVEQMGAVENFLRDRGVKPGMGLLDVYSTINAGSPGLYNRSDAANGGAPGTVADKVRSMVGHRQRAASLLGQPYTPMADAGTAPASGSSAAAPAATGSAATPSDGLPAGLLEQMQSIPKMLAQQSAAPAAPAPMDLLNADPAGAAHIAKLRAFAQAIASRQQTAQG
jgi:hypothetical protein